MNLLQRTLQGLRELRRGTTGPIGLHVAREAIHLVQLDLDDDRVNGIRAWASVPLDNADETLASPLRLKLLLRKALVSGGFRGRKVVAAMPHGKLKIHSLSYRPTRERSDAQEIVQQMTERLGESVADYVMDFLPVRDAAPNGERLALVAVSRRADVIEFLETLRTAGLDVLALDIGPSAIRRLVCAISPGGAADNVLVVNAGDRGSFLTMLSGRRLLFDQEIDFGEHKLISLVARTLDMPPAMVRELMLGGGLDTHGPQALSDTNVAAAVLEILRPELKRLVAEIERAFLYAASETRGGGARRVYLVGSIARWPGADRHLSKLAGVHVTNVPDPLATLLRSDGHGLPARVIPEIAVATGLALRRPWAAQQRDPQESEPIEAAS